MLALSWACLAPARAQTPPPPAAFAAGAEAFVNEFVKDGRFSGAVLVARDGQPVLREGFGLANREWDMPVGPDTEFRLGSLTKQFTAAAILQLAEQGKLKLDDPIGKYYASAPKTWDKITLAMLLSHRSGIPSYTDISGYFRGPARLDTTPEALIALTRDQPLEFEPGTKFKYDNTGYILLGYVVEKASGQAYADYLRDHVFAPLGMTHTGYEVSTDILPHRASGYAKEKGAWQNATYLSMTVPYAAGALYSTVDDLLIWDQALYGDTLLKPASRAAMFSDHGDKYGYGYVIDQEGGRRLWWHNGGVNGFHTYLARYPDQHVTVIVLSNLESAPVEKIGGALAHLNFGEPATPPIKAGAAARPGAEAALRRIIGEVQAGQVNYDELSPALADLTRAQLPAIKAMFAQFGALQSVTFKGADDQGVDVFTVKFANASTEWAILLDAKGVIVSLRFRPG